ncbi:hypothetical protein [Staphylococcus chromogenes]|uniref:hypothetical protein n=1 Tax=Staphylococcus chromogenes TaxID=46126 RepID=UPI003D79A065
MKERLLWFFIFFISLVVMIIVNVEFQFYSWFSVAFVFVICGGVSYILLEKRIANKKRKKED